MRMEGLDVLPPELVERYLQYVLNMAKTFSECYSHAINLIEAKRQEAAKPFFLKAGELATTTEECDRLNSRACKITTDYMEITALRRPAQLRRLALGGYDHDTFSDFTTVSTHWPQHNTSEEDTLAAISTVLQHDQEVDTIRRVLEDTRPCEGRKVRAERTRLAGMLVERCEYFTDVAIARLHVAPNSRVGRAAGARLVELLPSFVSSPSSYNPDSLIIAFYTLPEVESKKVEQMILDHTTSLERYGGVQVAIYRCGFTNAKRKARLECKLRLKLNKLVQEAIHAAKTDEDTYKLVKYIDLSDEMSPTTSSILIRRCRQAVRSILAGIGQTQHSAATICGNIVKYFPDDFDLVIGAHLRWLEDNPGDFLGAESICEHIIHPPIRVAVTKRLIGLTDSHAEDPIYLTDRLLPLAVKFRCWRVKRCILRHVAKALREEYPAQS